MYYTQRPVGLSIVAVLWWISAGLLFLAAIAVLGMAVGAASLLGESGGAAIDIGMLLSLLIFAVGGLGLAVGVGLWRMRPWAWWVAVILTGITVFLDFLSIFAVPLLVLSVGSVVLILVHVGPLIYLCTREAREACGVSGGESGYRPLPEPQPQAGGICPNPRCRRQLRAQYQFCPYCRTQLSVRTPRPRARAAARY